jgi:hypothetical protein
MGQITMSGTSWDEITTTRPYQRISYFQAKEKGRKRKKKK